MNETFNGPATPESIDDEVKNLLEIASHYLRERHDKCQTRIRENPTKAVLSAAAAGYLLQRLPIKAILVTQVRILAALTPPALLLFGAAKAYEFLQRPELPHPSPLP